MTRQRYGRFVLATAALIAIDLATKVWAVRALEDESINVAGPLDLKLNYNEGIAFGLVDRLPAAALITSSLLIATILVRAWHTGQAPTIPTIMIVAGALANSLDRVESANVVDMLHLGWWPTFNVADIYITSGVLLWVAVTALPTTPSRPRDVHKVDS